MHYKNGRPARNGDIILSFMNPQSPFVGVLFGAKAEAGSDCNGMIAPITPSGQWPVAADLKNCLHTDDIVAAYIPSTFPSPTLAPIGKTLHDKVADATEVAPPETCSDPEPTTTT